MYLISVVTQLSKYGNWCILKSFRFFYHIFNCVVIKIHNIIYYYVYNKPEEYNGIIILIYRNIIRRMNSLLLIWIIIFYHNFNLW